MIDENDNDERKRETNIIEDFRMVEPTIWVL